MSVPAATCCDHPTNRARTIVIAFVLFGLVAVSQAGEPGAEKKVKPRFTIGKETTYVTGPLDMEGYIDYAAALNERMRQGVTPENNACVLMWKALGPRVDGKPVPAEFFKELGIQEPPERGEYLVGVYPYLQKRLNIDTRARDHEITDQMSKASNGPWASKQFPLLHSWIEANEKPLALVAQATKRTHYYLPVVLPNKGKELPSFLESPSQNPNCRQLANALVIRAMLRAGHGRTDDAWQDLLAIHRLARQIARGPTILEDTIGTAIENVAYHADLRFLERGSLSPKQIRSCLADLQHLPTMPPLADKIDLAERFQMLLTVQRSGIVYREALSAAKLAGKWDPLEAPILEDTDWEQAMRNTNRWYDRMAAAARDKDRSAREDQLNQVAKEMKALVKKRAEPAGQAKFGGKHGAQEICKAMNDIWISLLFPVIRKMQQAADRTKQQQRHLQVAFALAIYHQEQGQYPKKLEELAPKYVPRVPLDLYSGKPLIYRLSGKGYLFYSVGPNGRDDEGRGSKDDPPGDDLIVRSP